MEEIQAFQARLHALHARIRTMFVLAARAIAQSEEAFGRELRAASGRMCAQKKAYLPRCDDTRAVFSK
jgi:hypothetical protein